MRGRCLPSLRPTTIELPYVPDFLLVRYELRYGAGVITDRAGGSEMGGCEEREREEERNILFEPALVEDSRAVWDEC